MTSIIHRQQKRQIARQLLTSCYFFSMLLSPFALSEQFFSKKITLVTEHLPPLQYLDENQQLQGYAYEVVSAAMNSAEIPYVAYLYPWTRSYNLVKKRPDVCIFSMARTPEREQQFQWIGRITEVSSRLYGLSKDGIELTSFEQAKSYNIAVIRDDVTHQLLLAEGFEEHKNLYVVENTDSLLKLLHSKAEIDFIVADRMTMPYRAKRAGIPLAAFKPSVTLKNTQLNFHLACNLDTDSSTIKRLRQGFNKIKASGVREVIDNRWRHLLGSTIVE